jgi:two-component system, chemotaxis family, sensor kinase CheA
MSIDLGQFLPIFFEETREHLEALESGLLAVDLSAPDTETVNAIFRAAHSIKGGAGTFGFTDVANFTHTLETLLDRVRHGDLHLDEHRVDVCLEAVDVLGALVAAHQGSPAVPSERVSEISTALAKAADLVPAGSEGHDTQTAPPVQAGTACNAGEPPPFLGLVEITWTLPEASTLPAGALENLIDTLAQLGRVEGFARPPGTQVSGEWQVVLETEATPDALRELIGFVLEPRSVNVRRLSGGNPAHEPLLPYGFFDQAPGLPDSADERASEGHPQGKAPLSAFSAEQNPAYGFFEPLPDTCDHLLSSTAEDPGYGFFEPLPDAQLGGPLAVVAPPKTPESEGFGFFDEAPGAPRDNKPQPPHTQKPAESDMGYGFFEGAPGTAPLTAPPSAPAPAPASEPMVKASRPLTTGPAPSGPPGDTSIRVGTTKVDQLINLVGELVITQSMLLQSARDLDPVAHERMIAGLTQLERNSRDLQEAVMSIRMVPMSLVFSRFPRMVRDLAKKLGKQAELHLMGESTELDKGLTEKIVDPLTHLVRNAVDHGLETTENRVAAGKSETGHITLAASHQSGHIVIEISDDGAGLNRERILSKARQNNIPVSDDMSDSDVWDLIFAPGFSTAEAVTDVSGRGVGMDVVRRNILALGGNVQLSSALGRGTRVSIRLPLTLAILDGMSVRVGTETFIVPLGFIIESLQGDGLELRPVGRDGTVVRVRDEYLPVMPLATLFGMPPTGQCGVFVVLEAENRKLALGVDELLGQHQVVVKNLETNYRRVGGISGATILGDGKVSLILDVNSIIQMAGTADLSQQGSRHEQ